MNEIVAGVKPLAGGTTAETAEAAIGAIGVTWLTVDGVELPVVGTSDDGAGNYGKVKVTTDPFLTVTVTLYASQFRTVRWDADEAPETYREKG